MKSTPLDLQNLMTVAIAILDPTGVLLEANAGFLRLIPPGHAPPIGAKIGRLFIQPTFAALGAATPGELSDGYRGNLTIGDVDGKLRTLIARVWRSAKGIHVVAEYDIAELERLSDAMLDLNQQSAVAQHALARANATMRQRENEIVEDSLTDALTGVGNRRKLDQAIVEVVERARGNATALSAIMTDIDHFKGINDEHGHDAGDKVLVRLGALLRSCTRSNDIVARFGGEEFVVLLPGANLKQATMKAEQLRAGFAADIIAPLMKAVTASFGVAELMPGEDGTSLLRRADQSLYQAKQRGRDQIAPSASDLHTESTAPPASG